MATLHLLGHEIIFALDQLQLGIGRAPDNEIVVDDETVSVYHALITIRQKTQDETQQDFIIEDLDSTNGTFVNNKTTTRHLLKDGDIIRVGNSRLKFFAHESAPPAQKEFDQTTKINPRHISSIMHKR